MPAEYPHPIPTPPGGNKVLTSPSAGVADWESSSASMIASITDYGAVGDDSHDDTTAIQAAINATPNGGILYTPPGVFRVPDGGLTCNGKAITLLGTGVQYQDATKGSVWKITATSGTLFASDSPGMVLDGMTLMHPSSGSRLSTLIGVSLTNANFSRIDHCMIMGMSTNAKIDTGIGWQVTNSTFRDFVLRGLDARYTGSPDSGDPLIDGCYFDRTAGDASTGGTAVYLSSIAGPRLNISVNGRLGAAGFDHGVLVDVVDGISTAPLRFTKGSIEGVKVAGVKIQYAAGASTGELWHPQIKNIEFNGLNNAGVTGIISNGPILRTPDFSGNLFASCSHVMNLVQAQGFMIIGNSGEDIATDGITLGSGCVNGTYDDNEINGALPSGAEFIQATSDVFGRFNFATLYGPEGALSAPAGSTCSYVFGGAGISLWVKESLGGAPYKTGWVAPITSAAKPTSYARRTSDSAGRNLTTTPTDDGVLRIIVAPGDRFWFECNMTVDGANATMGIKAGVSIPSGTCQWGLLSTIEDASWGGQTVGSFPTVLRDQSQTVTAATGGGNTGLRIGGWVVIGGGGGFFDIQWAQAVSDAGLLVIKAESFMKAEYIP